MSKSPESLPLVVSQRARTEIRGIWSESKKRFGSTACDRYKRLLSERE